MRILILEDDETINIGLKITLETEGYAVDTFLDAEKGARHVSVNFADYDLFIFDVMMPGKNGIDICRELRTKNIFIPILMLTALSNSQDKVEALDAGADDYLTKPFSTEELCARVRALLRRPREALPTTITVGPLVLNTNEKKILYKNTDITLTLKEFRILEYLLRNVDRVVTREQLLDHVWDLSFNSFSNVIEVHITSLRKKLKHYELGELIETIRGIGYQIKSSSI